MILCCTNTFDVSSSTYLPQPSTQQPATIGKPGYLMIGLHIHTHVYIYTHAQTHSYFWPIQTELLLPGSLRVSFNNVAKY